MNRDTQMTTRADAGTSGRAMTRPLVRDELQAVVSMLCARYPKHSRAEVQCLVTDVYRQLCDDARIHAHLIPLTLNRCRRLLSSERATRPKDHDGSDVGPQSPTGPCSSVRLAGAAV
jgi:hypothetical protein